MSRSVRAEAGVFPAPNIVGMRDRRAGDQVADPRRQGGLAVVAAPVHGQDRRAPRPVQARTAPDNGVHDRAQQLHSPRPGFGLFLR